MQQLDPEAIADGLTPKQEVCLVNSEGSVSVCRALKKKGLSSRTEGTGVAWLAYPELTSLGRQVYRIVLARRVRKIMARREAK